ncbi:2-oxoacid:acceptor oxidoreductase family protein [Jonquetella sp. BV3C21]|uniref:2-oxoacid:acceptor oxidoreductase family protein n=1 Tax=Jonquetella sp. BV3C21 TaxID=1111126 RepID=UPI0003ADF080|nr:2-oxoacid:acceptor oxidoreductase family protein [Jonquetella sp. BV3C21]ERL23509.1 putative 2-oxoglutarate ferredoxin oxidoreductase subunit gamma [Jonquetella sp. BV3C21]
MSKRFEICLAGSGGQGVITAAVMIGEAAAEFTDGLYAVQTQSYGPAARGGSAKAEVVLSTEPVDYPKPMSPDLTICLSGQAAEKYGHFVKPSGRLILDDFMVQEIPDVEANIYSLPVVTTARDVIGREIVTNMVALGMVARVLELEQVMTPDAIRKAMLDRVPKGTEELNAKAFDEGYKIFKASQSHHFQ